MVVGLDVGAFVNVVSHYRNHGSYTATPRSPRWYC